jgi:hypothetical protein
MKLKRPTTGTVLSVVAITLALGGTGYAATKIGTAQLKDGSVTSAKIKDGGVKSSDLASGAVTGAKIDAGAVDSAQIAGGAVTAGKIASAAVDGTKIAAGAVGTSKIAAGAVGTTQIAAAAVNGSKIAAASIDDTKVVPASLTGASIKPASIPAADIAAGSFITGTGLSQSSAGTLPSGTSGFRMLSLGGVDILADCTSQILKTTAEPFAQDLYVEDEVVFTGVVPVLAAGLLQPGTNAAQAVSNVSIGVVEWHASWTDATGAHVRTASISYQPGPGGCHFTASALAQN